MPCRLPGLRRRALRRRVRRPIYSHYDESTKWENFCYLQLIACVRQNVMNVLHDLKHMTLVHIYPYACTKWPEAYDIVTYILIHNDLMIELKPECKGGVFTICLRTGNLGFVMQRAAATR